VTELTIVLPTLNEAGNIGPLIAALRTQLPQAQVLVIDGDSADATREEATAAGAGVLINKQGYAATLLQGLRTASTEWAMVMDADGSHAPEDARKLWESRADADLVIGSRYAPGGGNDGNMFRRFLSRVLAGWFAWLARLPAKDVSSGFRLYRRALFADAEVEARFFEIQPALLAWAKDKGARVKEVGIHYRRRGEGRSKARVFKYGVAFLKQAWKLRSRSPKR
jgi:dolichol-phosphate mannosyltransferase